MSFIVRPVRHEDLNQLTDLARQFNLLNLPGDKKILANKIEVSTQSFEGKLNKHETVYVCARRHGRTAGGRQFLNHG
jgi:arginine N-succinyltransferase